MYPRTLVPPLSALRLGGPIWHVTESAARNFTMVVFYRGLHCPGCQRYLKTLDGATEKFRAIGVEPIALSVDTAERCSEAQQQWGLATLPLGHDVDVAVGAKWGVFVSERIRDAEPYMFFEPALFLVRPDLTLFYSSIQSMSFGRPDIDAMAESLGRVLERQLPARGERQIAQVAPADRSRVTDAV